jgi:iron complex outermembrane receptor protein
MTFTQTRRHRIARNCALAAICCLSAAQPAFAQMQDIGGASLSDLMRIEVERVFGASERLQPVTEAPAAVSIVTADEIRRYGYRTLGEILQGVRGFYVTNDRNYSYLGVRGFARAGDYNTRVLLLLNGQRVNDNVFDQAPIGAELDLDVAMIDRVEIIRGPASALYGTSAFFAVVNIITRTGADLNGTVIQGGGGSLGTRALRAMTGRRLDNGIDYFLAGSVQRANGVRRLYFPEFDDDTSDGVAAGLDGEQATNLYGQVRGGSWTISGGSGYRHKDVPTAAFGTAFNAQDPRLETDDDRSYLAAHFERPVGRNRVSLTGAFSHYSYAGVYPYDSEEGSVDADREGAEGSRLTIGARLTRPIPARQTVSVGVEFIDNLRGEQWLAGAAPENSWRIGKTTTERALFVQDEIALQRWLRVSAGLRFDDRGGFNRLTPRAAVIVGQSASQVVKYLYGRAFRAPNAYELYYWGDRSLDLTAEMIDTHEIVWERYTGEWLRTSAAAYRYEANDLISLRATDPNDIDSYEFVNEGRTTARGFEAEAEVRLKGGIQAFGSYTLQRSRDEQQQPISNSPRHLLSARASIGSTAQDRFASIELLHVGRRLTLASAMLPPVTLVNATVGVPVGRRVSLVGGGRNLFDVRYADPASDEHSMDTIEQNGRTFQVELRWAIGR